MSCPFGGECLCDECVNIMHTMNSCRNCYTLLDENKDGTKYCKRCYVPPKIKKKKCKRCRKNFLENEYDISEKKCISCVQEDEKWRLRRNEIQRQYYQENKLNNPEYLKYRSEKQRQYYLENKERIDEKRRERGREKISCECGSVISRHNKSCHQKSKKHQKYINNIKE